MSNRPKRSQASHTEQDENGTKKTKKGKLFCVFNPTTFIVSKYYEKEDEATNLKDQLMLMNEGQEMNIKDFKDESDYTAFKDACELKRKENISTLYIMSPETRKLNNPYAKSPGSISSIDTKRGGWVKKAMEGDSPSAKPAALSQDFNSSSMLATFSENLKKSAVELSVYRFRHSKARKTIVAVDMLDCKRNSKYWCHKAEWIAHVIDEDAGGNIKPKSSILDPFLHQFFAVMKRAASGGPDNAAFTRTKKGTIVYDQLLCAIIENGLDDQELKSKLSNFGLFASNDTIQQALHLTAQFNIEVKPSSIVDSHKPKLQHPTGVYYDKLEDAANNIKIYDLMALDELFLDKQIVFCICQMFEVGADPSEWDDSIRACAWKKEACALKKEASGKTESNHGGNPNSSEGED